MAKISTAKVFKQQLDPSAAFKPGESLENIAANIDNVLEADDALALNAQAFVSNHIDAPQTFDKDYNETVSAFPSQQTRSGEFPVYIIVIIAIVSFVMTSTFFYFLCRCLVRRKKREDQLANLTPKSIDHRMTGVRANQPIEFFVPTTVIVSETTEDSVSETDYSSSGAKNLPIIMDRRRKRPGFQINPEELQHGLYVGVTAASEKGAFIGDLGKVGFSLRYNLQRNQLSVKIIGAKDLPCQIMRTTANPCIKVVLLPDRTTKYMTKVLKNTTSPIFNETFTFCVRRDELPNKKLKISVWDYDRFSRKCLIGQLVYNVRDSGLTNTLSLDATTGEIWVDMKPDSAVNCPLCDSKFQRKNHFFRHMRWHESHAASSSESSMEISEDEARPEVRTVECQPEALQSSDNEVHPEMTTSKERSELTEASTHQHGENGEMLLSLCYNPDSANLTLSVLKIKGLNMQQDKGKDTSIYAKVTLYVRRKLVRTKKTPSRKKNPEVEFNSPFSIHVPQAALSEVDLVVAVCEKWPLGKRVLGRTQAGNNCLCDQGLQHWQDMLASPKSTCAQWHVLC